MNANCLCSQWNRIYLVAALFLLSGLSLAQKPPMKFGKIDPVLFEMKVYQPDSSAEAVILGDYGESRIYYDQKDGFMVEFTRHLRAKIFKSTGYDWAEGSIILYHYSDSKEQLLNLKGATYNLEGGKVIKSDLEKGMIFKEVVDIRRDQTKFTLPNVKEGSIIEYTYTIRSDYWVIPDWQFQYTIPSLWSEYRVSYPEYFSFKQLSRGYLSFATNEKSVQPIMVSITERERDNGGYVPTTQFTTSKFNYNDNVYRWVINDVPAFREEPYMNSLINYVSMIEFELGSYSPPFGMVHNYTETWEKINEELLQDEDFGLELNRGGFLKEVVAGLKEKNITPQSQMIASYEFVRNSMKWNERNRMYVTTSLKNAYEDKSGSSADINMLLVLLMREMGLDANPVIISTRSNGMLHPAQVMLNKFNYVIAAVNIGDRLYLLDATEKMCPYNLLPSRCINGQGRIINKNTPGWVDLNPGQKYEFTTMLDLAITTDGIMKGKIQRIHGKYAGLIERKRIADEKSQDDFVRSIENDHSGLSITNFEIKNLDSLYLPLIESFDAEITDVCQYTGNLLSFKPMLYEQITSNPFKLESRSFPVDFTYPRTKKYICNLTIPDGYALEEKPADIALALPEGKAKFVFKCQQLNNRLQLVCTLEVAKPLFLADDYAALKDLYGSVVKKQAEMIVLKKI